jgi:peptidoglycan/xylan/chitin deacetylase (PgdA/CDA1 family)
MPLRRQGYQRAGHSLRFHAYFSGFGKLSIVELCMPRIRLDRALSLSPLSRLLRFGEGPGVPILMYHSVGRGADTRHPYYDTNISPAVFQRHLQFLRREGYTTAYLSDIVEILQNGRDFQKLVAITFDDGFRSFYSQAFPMLSKYGFTATLFVPSGLVGQQNSSLGPEPFMTWDEIREVSRHGVHIGSHSVSHPDLYRLDSRALEGEVRFSKATIENNIGESVRSFAYPFAFPEHDQSFSRRFGALLQHVGYDSGVSTVIGRARRSHHRYVLPRLPVNSHDDPALFEAKLNGNYDWLHAPQYARKALKAFFSNRRAIQVSAKSVPAEWNSQS